VTTGRWNNAGGIAVKELGGAMVLHRPARPAAVQWNK